MKAQGVVTEYNSATGVAFVKLTDNRHVILWLNAFVGVEGNRHPHVGDVVYGNVTEVYGENITAFTYARTLT